MEILLNDISNFETLNWKDKLILWGQGRRKHRKVGGALVSRGTFGMKISHREMVAPGGGVREGKINVIINQRPLRPTHGWDQIKVTEIIKAVCSCFCKRAPCKFCLFFLLCSSPISGSQKCESKMQSEQQFSRRQRASFENLGGLAPLPPPPLRFLRPYLGILLLPVTLDAESVGAQSVEFWRPLKRQCLIER